MNNNESSSNTKGSVICGWCSYDNPPGSTQCQRCHKPFSTASLSTKRLISKPSTGLLGLFALLLFVCVGGGLFLWQQVRLLTSSPSLNISSEKNSSDIKLYNSIQEVPNVPDGTFNYGGAVLFASITAQGAHEAMTKAHPNFHLVFTEPKNSLPSQNAGLKMLIDGDLSFAQSAVALQDTEYKKAQARGFMLDQVPVAIDIIVFFTNPSLSIPGLSLDQLKDIYKGKITNWKQVGGPDLEITPFARDPKTVNLLNVLLGPEIKQLSSRVQIVNDYTDSIRKVAATPGGISFGGSGPILGQHTIRPLAIAKGNSQNYVQPFISEGKQINVSAVRDGSYPLSRRLFIVIRRDGKIDEQVGVAYANMLLSTEGQQYVAKGGFLPLR